MKKKNRAFYRYFIPVIYAVFVYILWELTGTLVAYVVGKVMDNWEETLYSSYISMLFNEVLTFVIMFVLFRKKADFVRKEKRNGSWLPVLGMFIFPLIQIGNDLMTLVHGKKVFSLLSGKGICFFLICGVASLSIGLLEEYVWRGILLNMFLAAWGKKNLLCGSCVFPWIWSVPLPESAGGTELCRYDKTGIVCDLFWHVSGSTFYTDESFIHSGSCTWTL